MKYVVTYKTKFGNLSAESEFPEDLLVGYETIANIAGRIGNPRSPSVNVRRTAQRENRTSRLSEGKLGKGETASILREIDLKLLNGSFFSKARTTGETKKKLDEVAGRNFTSRKVSQALGILWQKGILRRSGTRNYFAYSKK